MLLTRRLPRQTVRIPLALALVLGTYLGSGCGPSPKGAGEISPQATAEATKLFTERCARCHGALGKGDGPDAAKAEPRPRNFSDPTWQLAVPDSHLDKVIAGGGPAVGKSPVMPANPDLASNPELLRALRQHLRTLAASP